MDHLRKSLGLSAAGEIPVVLHLFSCTHKGFAMVLENGEAGIHEDDAAAPLQTMVVLNLASASCKVRGEFQGSFLEGL